MFNNVQQIKEKYKQASPYSIKDIKKIEKALNKPKLNISKIEQSDFNIQNLINMNSNKNSDNLYNNQSNKFDVNNS